MRLRPTMLSLRGRRFCRCRRAANVARAVEPRPPAEGPRSAPGAFTLSGTRGPQRSRVDGTPVSLLAVVPAGSGREAVITEWSPGFCQSVHELSLIAHVAPDARRMTVRPLYHPPGTATRASPVEPRRSRQAQETEATVSSRRSLPPLWSRGFGSASDCRRYRRTSDGIARIDRSGGESSILSVLSILSRGLGRSGGEPETPGGRPAPPGGEHDAWKCSEGQSPFQSLQCRH